MAVVLELGHSENEKAACDTTGSILGMNLNIKSIIPLNPNRFILICSGHMPMLGPETLPRGENKIMSRIY